MKRRIGIFMAAVGMSALAALGGSWSDGNAKAADWTSASSVVRPFDGCAKTKLVRQMPVRSVVFKTTSRGMHARRPLCGGGVLLYKHEHQYHTYAWHWDCVYQMTDGSYYRQHGC